MTRARRILADGPEMEPDAQRLTLVEPPLRVCMLARNDCVRAVLKLEFQRDPGQRRTEESAAADYVSAWVLLARKERPPENCADHVARGKWLLGRLLQYCQDRIDAAGDA